MLRCPSISPHSSPSSCTLEMRAPSPFYRVARCTAVMITSTPRPAAPEARLSAGRRPRHSTRRPSSQSPSQRPTQPQTPVQKALRSRRQVICPRRRRRRHASRTSRCPTIPIAIPTTSLVGQCAKRMLLSVGVGSRRHGFRTGVHIPPCLVPQLSPQLITAFGLGDGE